MKSFGTMVVVFALGAVAAVCQQAPPQVLAPVTLAEGTEVKLKLGERLNSRTAKPGDPVELALAEDLKVDADVVARAGSRALGTVVHTKTPDFSGEPGELNLRVQFLKVGKIKVPLRGALGGTGVRYVIIRGSQAVMPAGTPMVAYVDADTVVNVAPPLPR